MSRSGDPVSALQASTKRSRGRKRLDGERKGLGSHPRVWIPAGNVKDCCAFNSLLLRFARLPSDSRYRHKRDKRGEERL